MPLNTDEIKRLIDLEAAEQDVDPRLAQVVAQQESWLNPNAVGDKGQARGIFQLHEGAAKDAGIDPARRHEVPLNIEGGVRYLKQQLARFGGDQRLALAAYNAGPTVVQAYGKVPPYKGVQRYVADAMALLSPRSAEASGLSAAERARLAELDASLAQDEGQAVPQAAPATSPSPPTATSTPEQDAADRASRGQQPTPPASQAAPPTTTPPGGLQGPHMRLSLGDPAGVASAAEAAATIAQMRARQGQQTPALERFLALPSIQSLPPEEREAAQQEFQAMQTTQQEEVIKMEQPGYWQHQPGMTVPGPSAGGGRAPVPPAPAALAGMSAAQRAAQGIELIPESGAAFLQDRLHEAGIPMRALPAIAVNTLGTVGGAALGAPLGPVGSAAGAALGGSLATRLNTALGLAGQEKPMLETPWANVYPSDLLGAIPLGVAGATAALKGTVRNLPGANVGRHELAAEKLEQLGTRALPARPSSELFTEAAAQGGAVPMPTLWRAAGKVVREEKGMQKGFVSTEAMQAGNGLLNLMRKHGGNVPLDEVEKYRQRLFQKIQTTTDKAELKRLQDLYGSIHEDLALAAGTGTAAGAGTLKAAIAAKRKEHAQETLTDVWSPGKGLQLQEGNHTQIYGKRIRNEVEKRLHHDKLFAGSFTAAETVDIRNTLREVGKLTRMTNPDAQGAVGSTLKWLGRLGGAGGAGYGVATGDLSTLMTGGAMLLATEGTTAVLSNAMQSKVGRWALREAIREGNGTLTHGSLSAIAALVAREAAPEAPAPAPAPTP